MTKATVDERIVLGREANRLLSDPLFNGVISVLLRDAINGLQEADLNSNEAIQAHAEMKSLNKIKAQLRALASDGTIATKEAEKRHP